MSIGRTVTVRMYHVGFGDCFLLRFPDAERDRLVLIDCGVHTASLGGQPMATVVGDIIKTATEVTGRPWLDVVVATHRHRDHVDGFRDARWRDVEVGEVWLPWTEDPEDANARAIKDKQSKRTRLLLELAGASTGTTWNAVRAIADNNDLYKNAQAMAMLLGGFAGPATPAYLPEAPGRDRSSSFTTPALPRVTIDVLGPQRSEAAIRDMDPPGDQKYLRLGNDDQLGAAGRPLPFDPWALPDSEFLALYPHLEVRADIGAIINSGRDTGLGIAVALEKAVNGTSLMLLFRVGEVSLLFAGDAQWGTWDAVLSDPARRALLEGVVLYKVGHHGSHNATPRRFVEEVTRKESVALVPVAPTNIGTWSQIPRKELLVALQEHGAYVIRSDKWANVAADEATREKARVRGTVKVAPYGLWTEIAFPVDAVF